MKHVTSVHLSPPVLMMDADVRGEGGPRIWAPVCMTHFSKTAVFKVIPRGGGGIWKEDTGVN